MATSTGAASASARRVLRTPMPTARRSGARPAGSLRTRATSSATRCGPGRASWTLLSCSAKRSPSATKERLDSASTGRVETTQNRDSAADAIPARRTVVLPIPASPSSSNAPGSDSVDSRKARTTASSSSLPTRSGTVAVTLVYESCRRTPHLQPGDLPAPCAVRNRIDLGVLGLQRESPLRALAARPDDVGEDAIRRSQVVGSNRWPLIEIWLESGRGCSEARRRCARPRIAARVPLH
jgi:hypothetical protein